MKEGINFAELVFAIENKIFLKKNIKEHIYIARTKANSRIQNYLIFLLSTNTNDLKLKSLYIIINIIRVRNSIIVMIWWI